MLDTVKEFNDFKGFNKAYNELRLEIIERHGYKPTDKVRLNGVVVMYQNFGHGWLKTGTVKTDMIERVKKYEGKKHARFKLESLV